MCIRDRFCGGFGRATSVMLGMILGRGDFEKAKRVSRLFTRAAVCTGIVMGGFVLLLSPLILSGFQVSMQSKEQIRIMLFIMAAAIPLRTVVYMDICGILRSGGDNIYCLSLIHIYFLQRTKWTVRMRTQRIINTCLLYTSEHVNEGCYNMDFRIKRMNRKAEERLLHSDFFLSMRAAMLGKWSQKQEELKHLWKTLLFNQLHDTLGGTTIKEARDEAVFQLSKVCAAVYYTHLTFPC